MTRSRLEMRGKRLLSDLGVALLLLLVAAIGLERRMASQLRSETEADLLMLQALRTSALQRELGSSRSEVALWSGHGTLRDRFSALSAAWLAPGSATTLHRLYGEANPYPVGRRYELRDAGDGSAYSELHSLIHGRVERFLEAHGYHDIFLIEPDGDVVYTYFKEEDFGSNLISGPGRQAGLADVFRAALASEDPAEVAFADFAPYEPSAGSPSAFLASPVVGDAGELIGVLAVQITADAVSRIMQFTAGMGETGETYAVGEDLLMRSVSRFSEGSTILETRADTEPVRRALAGESGVIESVDYRGVRVLSAYGTLRDEDVRWAVVAEKDLEEIMQPLGRLRRFLAFGALAALLIVGLLSLSGMLDRPAPLQTSPLEGLSQSS